MHKVLVAVAAVGMIALAGNAHAFAPNNTAPGQGDPGIVEGTYHGPLVAASTAIFPVSSDTWTVASYPYWWHAGDSVVGSRTMGLSSVDQAHVHLVIDGNYLNGTGHVEMECNFGVVHATTKMDVMPEQSVVDTVLVFPPIDLTDPVSLEYRETNTVDPGAGSIVLNETGSSWIELEEGATATQNSTWGQIKSLYR